VKLFSDHIHISLNLITVYLMHFESVEVTVSIITNFKYDLINNY